MDDVPPGRTNSAMSVTGPASYERARPVFDTARRRTYPILDVVSVALGSDDVRLVLRTGGAPIHARVRFVAPSVARIQWAVGGPPGEHSSEMLAGEPDYLAVHVEETAERIAVAAGGPALIIERSPWEVRFGPYATEPDDTSLVGWIAPPSGYAVDGDRVLTYETFRLSAGEELYGLGERFHGPALRGRRLAHWLAEPWGTNTTDRVHKSVPLVVSSEGYGLFFHHSEELTFDLGAGSAASGSVLIADDQTDLFVMLGSAKEVLASYTALTGRASVPPEWSFGIWYSRCMYRGRAEVVDVVETAHGLGLPIGVVNLDPLWLDGRAALAYDTCDFRWDAAAWGDLSRFANWLHERDVRLCLWINCHVDEASSAWRPDRLVSGGRARDEIFPVRGYVDPTGGGADWWREELASLLARGVDAFKVDYGETLPVTAQMADGRTGAGAHNLYPLLLTRVVHEAGAPVLFTRAATAGSQRYPLHWAGDSQSSWSGFHGALRGGLAAAWSGFAHWTSDVGGFYRRDLRAGDDEVAGLLRTDHDLYVRWMQFGMLSSHTRFHGKSPREPWHFGQDAVAIARRFAELRQRLVPYLLDCSAEAASTGCPVLRPVALEHPDDAGARHVDTEYLLGPDVLVCPVLRPDGRADVYLPPGKWVEHFTGERATGPAWKRVEEVPLDRLPLYVRHGTHPIV